MFENNCDFEFDDEFEDVIVSSFTPSASNDRFFNNVNKPVQNAVHRIQGNVQPNSSSNKFVQAQHFKKPCVSFCNKTNETNIATTRFVHESPRVTKKVVKRKFPGPAGLLPDEQLDCTNFQEILHCKRVKAKSTSDNEDELVCSQRSATTYEDGPWAEMEKDFSCSSSTGLNLYNKYNIRWIKNTAGTKKLISQKVPFLAAIIQSIDGNSALTNVNLTLKDMTGEIEAAILHTLYQEYSEELTIGSVIVLKQFGVITASSNRHYLTITQNNLLAIYTRLVRPLQESDSDIGNLGNEHINNQGRELSQVRSSRMVKKTVLQKVSSEEIIRQTEESFTLQEKTFNKTHYLADNESNNIKVRDKSFNHALHNSLNDAIPVPAKNSNTVSNSVQQLHHKKQNEYSRTHGVAFDSTSVESISTPENFHFSDKSVPCHRNDLIQDHHFQFGNSQDSNMNFNANFKTHGLRKDKPFENSDINSLESEKSEEPLADHQKFKLVFDKNRKNDGLEKKINFGTKTVTNIFDNDLDDICFEEDFIPDSYESNNVNNNSSKVNGFGEVDDIRPSVLTELNGHIQFPISNNNDNPERSCTKNKNDDSSSYRDGKIKIPILKTNQDIPSRSSIKNKLEVFKFKPKFCDTFVNKDDHFQEGLVNREKENENKVQMKQSFSDTSVIIGSSQLSIKTTNKEHNQIWKSVLDDLDTDSLFEDF